MSGCHSTKRQSNLEIRTHLRLLPKKVAKPKEQQQLLRKHDQIRHWIIQSRLSNTTEPLLGKLLKQNYETIKLSHKYYSEQRREKFDRMTRSLRDTESKLIKKSKSVHNPEAEHKPNNDQSSFYQRVISGLKYLFCCNH